MKKSSFWWNLLLFGLLMYIPLSMFNNSDTKPIGSISYSQYIENIHSKNIYKIIATNYSNDLTVFTKEPIKTLEYERAFTENKRYENNDNLTFVEKIKKKFNIFPTEQDLKILETSYYEKSYKVLAPENVKSLFEKIDLTQSNIYVEVKTMGWFLRIISFVLSIIPTLLLIIFIIAIMTRYSENSGLLGEYKTNKNEKRPNVKLSDVVGIEEDLKLEIIEIIDFIKNPEKFKKLGAKSPKGILMTGAPGVGKTLLAKAIANEAGVDFYYRSASDLENPYVGMSAKTVKNLFKEARRSKNAIIFIDEIDSIGSRQSKQVGKVDTGIINAMLTEMDGFEENENIVVIGATNHPDKLDPAMLREGRFDRKVAIPLPNVKGRQEILEFYTKNKKMADDVDLKILAKLTTEYSGAELAGIINEASIQAVREKSEVITQSHLMKARDKKIMGVPFKSFEQSEKQKEITAYHEAGHAILSYFLDKNNKLYKVSILPRTGSLGVTVLVPLEENVNYNKTELNNMIQVLFGGRIAEEIFFNEVSTGASNDIQRANNIAERMVKEWGMSELGMINVDNTYERRYSENLLQKIDETKNKILNQNYEEAKAFLIENKKLLDKLAKLLIEKEEIDFEEIENVLSQNLTSDEFNHLKETIKKGGFKLLNLLKK